MKQLRLPAGQPIRASVELLLGCIQTAAGGRTDKAHLLGLGLWASCYEGGDNEGVVIASSREIVEGFEHRQNATLRSAIGRMVAKGIITREQGGRWRRHLITPKPDKGLWIPERGTRESRMHLRSLPDRFGLAEAASRARTGHWRTKSDLMAFTAICVALGNERGSVRISRRDLARLLEYGSEETLDKAKNRLRDLGYIEWVRSGRENEFAILINRSGEPQFTASPETEPELVAVDEMAPPNGGPENTGLLPAQEQPATENEAAYAGNGNATSVDATHEGLPGSDQADVMSTEGQVAALCGKVRATGRVPDEDYFRKLSKQEASQILTAWGGTDSDPARRRLRARVVRQQMQEKRKAERTRQPIQPEPTEAQQAARRRNAEESARERGYVPTDDGDWIQRDQAGQLGYHIKEDRAVRIRYEPGTAEAEKDRTG